MKNSLLCIFCLFIAGAAMAQNGFIKMCAQLEKNALVYEGQSKGHLQTIDTLTDNHKMVYQQYVAVKNKADALVNLVDSIQCALVIMADGNTNAVKNGKPVLNNIKNVGDYDTPTLMLAKGPLGLRLQTEIANLKNYCMAQVDTARTSTLLLQLNTDGEDGETLLNNRFDHNPLAATLAQLYNIQRQARIAEESVLFYLVTYSYKP